ncbi:MAG: hypothetical protein Q4C89_01565, partial [Deinococcus sp.]|uniref:hypothetical protein n=1 Tax=Deinococcus sp. TaxID=47478 RepID=UPI0026DA8482
QAVRHLFGWVGGVQFRHGDMMACAGEAGNWFGFAAAEGQKNPRVEAGKGVFKSVVDAEFVDLVLSSV